MANQNQKANGTTGDVVNQQVQNDVPAQTEPQNQQPAETEEKGFGAFCKRNWKKIVAGVTGALAIGGSAVVAYKKGKAAGIMSVPVPQQSGEQEDYSLNPNE